MPLTFDIVPSDGREVSSTVIDGAVQVRAPGDVTVGELAEELSALLTLSATRGQSDPVEVEVVPTEQDEPHETEACWLGSRLLVFAWAGARLDVVAQCMSRAMTLGASGGGETPHLAAGALVLALLPRLLDVLT